jgi:hypothetical protein
MKSENRVHSAFESVLEEIEDAIEGLNRKGASAFQKGDYTRATALTERGSRMATFRGKVVALRKEWDQLFLAAKPPAKRRSKKRKAKRKRRKRLRRGLRTPEEAFYAPILQALVDAGGATSRADALEAVGAAMEERFNRYDRSSLRSTPGIPRWRTSAQWARNTMVNDGRLAADSPRGTWAITAAGRRWLKANG